MKPIPILCILGLLAGAAFPFLAKNTADPPPSAAPAAAPVADEIPASTLDAYAVLSMEEIFVTPAGPKGLVYSDKARALDGRKVQVTGHMVRHAHADPRLFLFAPRPMVLLQSEFGIADDLPPYALHVVTDDAADGKAARYLRDELRLLGTLHLGQRQEIDGRVSHVRLQLDHVTAPDGTRGIPILASLAMQPERLLNANRLNPAADILQPTQPKSTP